MKVYSAPLNIQLPSFDDYFINNRYSMERDNELSTQYIQKLKTEMIRLGWRGKLTGEIVRFPIADGYAQYMVVQTDKKTALIWLELGDAWQIPDAHARGLRLSHIQQRINSGKNLNKIFGGNHERTESSLHTM